MTFDQVIWLLLVGWLAYQFGRWKGAHERPDAPQPKRPPGELSPAAKRRMEEAIHRGATIEAIRIVRDDTGSGLKEAKAFVQSFGARRAERRPGDPIER